MNLTTEIMDLAGAAGADFSGVADLTPARAAIMDQGGALLGEYPRAVSIGLTLPHAVVDRIAGGNDPTALRSYRHHAYDVINQRLDQIASRLSARLQKKGHGALPIPASMTVDHDRLTGVFSNKMAAHLAGLGWIGKSCLLITPEVGPRARWASVLTTAPLEATGEPMEERCGSCDECVRGCPPQAFSGRPFREDEHRDLRFQVHKCRDMLNDREREMGIGVCGMCLYICPYGRRASETIMSAAG